MLKITFLRGLPGSGKSTIAKQMVLGSNCGMKRVNKDDIRAMLDAGKYSKGNEAFVLKVRDSIIMQALLEGKHVVVDDTNFEDKHLEAVRQIATAFAFSNSGIKPVIEERFIDTPLDECIARDNARPNGVGEKVIRTMYNKYLRPSPKEWERTQQDPSLPQAIIVDIDGTIARMAGRSPFEWSRVGEDIPNDDVIDIVRQLSDENRIIIMSGRDESCRLQTEEWLDSNLQLPYDMLLMRPAGNMEKDTVIKERLYNDHVKGSYFISCVIDDRSSVVGMWRGLGLRCLQVADGDF